MSGPTPWHSCTRASRFGGGRAAIGRREIVLSWETVIDAIVIIPFFVSYFDLPYLQYIYVPYFFRVAGINGKLQMVMALVSRLNMSKRHSVCTPSTPSRSDMRPDLRPCHATTLRPGARARRR